MQRTDRHNLTAKQRKQIHIWLRAFIQLFFFLLFPSAFTAAFAGIKYIFTQIGAGEKIGITSFITVLIVVCVYTIVFGRFFCGFACAFGSFGDAVHAIYVQLCKKLKKKPLKLKPELTAGLAALKFVVLAIIVIMCFAGVYSKAQGTSPWDVFSLLHAGVFALRGYGAGIVLLLLLIVGMCVQERFFCRFFCPMGAIFSLLPVLPFFSLHREREQCLKGCSGCTRQCPSNIELPAVGTNEVIGDCFQCQKCIDTCPRKNINCGVGRLRGNEIGFTLIRAFILLGLYIWLGL